MQFVERTFRDALGATVIQSRLRPAVNRQDFERLFFPGVRVGLAGWQRAHSQGAGTGFESPNAIRYAPEEVNQQYQRLGIERHLRDLLSRKPADVELWLTTVTSTHPRTLRLKEIQYRLDAVRGTQSRRLFEASIGVSDSRDHPRVTVQATPFGSIS
jgi:putative RNase toxin 4 of polymorphic toxin system